MLSMDGPSEKGTDDVSMDDNAWAGFQGAGEASTAEKAGPTTSLESNKQSPTGIEDLFKDTPSITPPLSSRKDVKNDIMSLFEKSNMVSPFSLHQQQLAMLAQQQSILMAAAANSTSGAAKIPGNAQPLTSNGNNLSTQNWPNAAYQVPETMPVAGGNSLPFAKSSMYTMGHGTTKNGVPNSGVSKQQLQRPSMPSISPSATSQLGKDYDFSTLTQGFFPKP